MQAAGSRVAGIRGGNAFALTGFRPGQQPLDHRLGHRQELEETAEQPGLLGVGADDQRHAVRLAARAWPRPDPAAGSPCPGWARPQTRRASRAGPCRTSRSKRVDQLGRAGRHHGVGAVLLACAEQCGELSLRTRPRSPECGPFRLAGLSEIAWANRPLAAGTASSVATACAPALSPKIVTLSGSPPNTAMLSRTQRSAITRSRRNRLSSKVMSVVGQRGQVQAAQRTQPVVHRDIDAALARQRCAVVDRRRRAAHEVAAAVDEHHHRQRVIGRAFGRDDVERQAVLAHRLVLAGREDRVHALLRCAIAESVAVPHARPRLHRLRGAQPQRAHRRPRVRNRSPAVHAVAGEAFDRAGLDGCADDVFVHDPTVSNEPRRRAWPAIACRPASLGRYADCWPDCGVCAGGGVFTVGRRGCRAVDAVVDGAAEHDARRTIDHVAYLDDSRPTARPRGADRRRHRLGRSGRAGRPGSVSLRDARRRNDRLGEDVAFVTPSGKANCMTDSKYSARRAGVPGGSEESAAAARRTRTASGRAAGSTSTASSSGRLGARRPRTVRRRQSGRNCRTVSRWRSATTAAAATRPAWSASTTRFQSAARFSDAGVQPFGCLKPSAPMPQVGEVFSC